ncbi:MAG TPA: tRNA (adenosine(37)-N6)-threonylcarbamoyltransferase complex transferase subunit TsaD [Candidatus Norongarragalinales archaeon]|nr:tRNA (adenosine(37)-N6)-threonylcarbamoyltransferase complex transferase subunit TsaD [Candidatus Norongarragalinales archaeon]
MALVLGIESTAHTLGAGIVESHAGKIKIKANALARVPHTKKGFVPRLLAEHHSKEFRKTIEKALREAGISLCELNAIAFSQGPGMGPALRVGFVGAKALSELLGIPLLPVNHAIAHCEIGKWQYFFKDPLVLYVSGGNTQILVLDAQAKRYHVLGETLDVGVGNFLDVFAREFGLNNAIEVMRLAEKGETLLELPYTIKGMNCSFTGLLTYCARNYREKVEKKAVRLEDVCFSVQETVFAILTEATERALYHSQKKEVLACGGVACNARLKEMLSTTCKENRVKFGAASDEFNRDNGAMIALVGAKMLEGGVRAAEFEPLQRMRPEAQDLGWMFKAKEKA